MIWDILEKVQTHFSNRRDIKSKRLAVIDFQRRLSTVLLKGEPTGAPFIEDVINNIQYKEGFTFSYDRSKNVICINYKTTSSTAVPDYDVQEKDEILLEGRIELGAVPYQIQNLQEAKEFILSLILFFEFHEVKEYFKYKGELAFDPHSIVEVGGKKIDYSFSADIKELVYKKNRKTLLQKFCK